MKLVVVESPTKSKTLQGFLGPKYRVLSSYGHIRDLPKSELGVDIENNFQPKYVIPLKSRKVIQFLKNESEKSELTIIATDEDREGEAIGWHLIEILNLNNKKPYQRIVFHEITKTAIEEALKNPRKIEMSLVDAQQARRILDRIVGYKLSPFLWKKVARGLSAGRVQSVAVRLIVEREKEIKSFVPQEYWTITALLKKMIEVEPHSFGPKSFEAVLIKKDGKVLDKLTIKNNKEAEKIVKDLNGAEYEVINIERKEVRRNPLPPFTTSTVQQTAWQKFHWPAKITMMAAQQLYERGFITYHRTDSLNLSNLALGTAKKFITENYGENYYQFRKFKTKAKGAQEAHEAIRPSYPERSPDKLKLEERSAKLYDLIWQRFIACQMSQAVFDSTAVEIEAGNPKYVFRAMGQILKFDGFLKIYPIKYDEKELPLLEISEFLTLIKLTPSQHFTEPKPRYNEASLIKALEENGIGRPSTYAPILSTIQQRNYAEKDEAKRFVPTEIGTTVNDLLVKHFPEIVDINFTAKMEENLDAIANDKKEWIKTIREFYSPFEKNLTKKYKEVLKEKIAVQETEKKCPKCNAPLLIRLGKFGKFYACSQFPKCRHTESLPENTLNIKCPKCQKGEIVAKRTKSKKIFYGCNQFPKCDFALWDKPINKTCKDCGSLLIEKNKKIICSNRTCKNASKK